MPSGAPQRREPTQWRRLPSPSVSEHLFHAQHSEIMVDVLKGKKNKKSRDSADFPYQSVLNNTEMGDA